MASNHLTIVRWALASFVLLGHAWLLSTNYEPFKIFNWTGSFMAVNGFFILSGLLIAKSLHMRNDLKAYTMSRALRIYPALITVLLCLFLFSAHYFLRHQDSIISSIPIIGVMSYESCFSVIPKVPPAVYFPQVLKLTSMDLSGRYDLSS